MFDVVFCCCGDFLFNVFPKDPLICPRKGVYHAFYPLVQGWTLPTLPWGRYEISPCVDLLSLGKPLMIRILTKMATWTRRSEANVCHIEVAARRGISVKNPPRCESCSYGYFVGVVSKLLNQFNEFQCCWCSLSDPFKGQSDLQRLGIKRSLDRFTQTELDSHSLSA